MDKILSPEVKMKMSTMEAAYRLRKGSPDFRKALRERCRHQVKAKRSALFDNFRNTNSKTNIQETLSEIFSSELNLLQNDMNDSQMEVCGVSNSDDITLDHELEVLDEIRKEILQEEECWILQEFEKFLESESIIFDPYQEERVVCPICLCGSLSTYRDSVRCPNNCVTFPITRSLSDINQSLQFSLQVHNSICSSNPQFLNFFENEIKGLHMICHDCTCFQEI